MLTGRLVKLKINFLQLLVKCSVNKTKKIYLENNQLKSKFHLTLMIMRQCQRNWKLMYSQTCVQRPLLGPQKSGRYSEVVAIQRVIKKN